MGLRSNAPRGTHASPTSASPRSPRSTLSSKRVRQSAAQASSVANGMPSQHSHTDVPSEDAHSRSLEPEWAVDQYGSLGEFVEAERLRLPRWLSWWGVSLFCSLHIIGPAALGLFVGWAVMCYRGASAVQFLEYIGSVLAADNFRLFPSPLRPALDGLAHAMGSSKLYSVGREVVMCPAATHVHTSFEGVDAAADDTTFQGNWWNPADWLSRHAFDADGVSLVCVMCEKVDPGVIVLGFVALMLLSLLHPTREWRLFARFFETFFDIFSFRFVIDESRFDPHKRYVFVAVPHGVVPLGSFMAIAYIRQFLPGLDASLGVASVLFRLPFLRQFFLWLGCVPASKDTLASVLAGRGGKVAIMPGGVAEIFLSSRENERIFLKQRKGFVRLAIEADAEVVPVYIFGQTQLFDQMATNDSVLMRISRRFAASITFFWGRWYLPIPYPARVTCVVGNPIDVRACAGVEGVEDGKVDVDAAHAAVCDSIREIHDSYRSQAGYESQSLEIL